jgi:uncharacterized protein (DUF488 family)
VATVFTIGHSTRTQDDLLTVLRAHQVVVLVDIRSFPASRRLPHFNREQMEIWLPQGGVEYVWERDLGGRRKKQMPESPNIALRSDSFRNYADYMLGEQFQAAAARLLELAAARRTAIMCAERLWFQCHRMMVSDYLVAHGHEVLHIADEKPPKPHALMPEARMVDGRLLYRGDRLF